MTHQALAAGLAMTFMTAPVAAQAATNAIVLHVSRHPGAAASDVAGTAPPFAPIVVTLPGVTNERETFAPLMNRTSFCSR